jgi:alpha-beta hydrolase superfamily lysophospholipase
MVIMRYKIYLALLVILLTGCMPMIYPPGVDNNLARLSKSYFFTEDGAALPLRHWQPKSDPYAIIIALHGFNDYSSFFELPGEYFSNSGIACFAYDQRGFGGTTKRGLWAGDSAYSNDLLTLIKLLSNRFPNKPVYLIGESMGGAIIINTMSKSNAPAVAGVVLAAPALWAKSTMPWYQTSLLWTMAHSMPWLTLTGKGVKVTPSDNIKMLRALGKDPLVIKSTRIETLYGLSNLMDEAFNNAALIHGKTLMLYGEKDDIIPKEPTHVFLQTFLETAINEKTVAFYQNGYHMLLRDLQAETVWTDIAAWIKNKSTHLPSGADIRAKQALAKNMYQTTNAN